MPRRNKSCAAAAQFALWFSSGCDLSGPATAEFVPQDHSAYLYWGFYLEVERKHDPSALDQELDEFSIFLCSSFRKCCFVPGDAPSELL